MTTQPSKVSTEDEAPRPPDTAVVTDETESSGQQTDEAAAAAKPNEDKSKSSDGSNESDSATDPKNQQANQRKPRDRHSEKRMRILQRQLAAERDRSNANERKIAELTQELDSVRGQLPTPTKPVLKDFDTPEEFADAYADWKAKTASSKRQRAKAKTDPKANGASDASSSSTAQPPRASDEELTKFSDRGKEKLGDEFLLALQDQDVSVNKAMGDFILASDFGPELYVYLSDNHEIAEEIFNESKADAKRRLTELETKAKAGELIKGLEDQLETGKGKGGDDDKGGETAGKGKAAGKGKGRPGDTKAGDPPSENRDSGVSERPVNLETAEMDDYAAIRRSQIEKAAQNS